MPDGRGRPFIDVAVEGETDEAIARRLIGHAGGRIGKVRGGKGKAYLRRRIAAYNSAARYSPWFVLVDLDSDADCAAALRSAWLSSLAARLCFRIAVREVEAWLMADAESLARYLNVPRARVPRDPEGREDPKGDMVGLARRSRRRELREDMTPGADSRGREGPAYAGRLVEYAETAWRPEVAAQHSDSLRRAIACLRRLVAGRGEAAA